MTCTGKIMEFAARFIRRSEATFSRGEVREVVEHLQPFLPAALELEEMSIDDFGAWVNEAERELRKRAEKRDPLFHLKKRISSILKSENIPEDQREASVYSEIERYFRIIRKSQ